MLFPRKNNLLLKLLFKISIGHNKKNVIRYQNLEIYGGYKN